jgi:prepilin-type N-terminal cleavage/methylation domain-containing protein
MKLTKLNQDQAGFTVVELIVSIVVGAILVGSVNTIVTTQIYISQRGRDLVMANAYAELKIESLRSVGYLGLADGTTDITGELPNELSSPRSASQVISPYTADIKEVALTITYNEQGKSRTHTYKTYVGELGVGQY